MKKYYKNFKILKKKNPKLAYKNRFLAILIEK